MASPRLTHVFDLAAYSTPIEFPTEVNDACNLYAAGVEGGTISTTDGSATFEIRNASDWMTLEASGNGVIVDARVNAQSIDGGLDIQYQGKLRFSTEMIEMMQGKRSGTDFGEGYYYVSPRISTRMEAFKWVNETVFLGQGRIQIRPDGKLEVSYRIYKVD